MAQQPEEQRETVDVALVSLPWAPPTEPSLGLAILKESLNREQIGARVFHMAPALLRWCSIETYAFIADLWAFDDFLFTGVLDADVDEAQKRVLQERVVAYAEASPDERYSDPASMLALAWKMRDHIIPEFLDYTLNKVLVARPKLIGLSCLFDQTIASVALAKRLKQVAPDIPIVMGGYALEGPPGLTVGMSFPWIDLIVVGDGEEVVVELARDALAGRGLRSRATTPAKLLRTSPVNLAASPLPDYDDWFSDLRELEIHDRIQIRTKALPVESSRGCWWGQGQHCIFCGIDDETLKYRHKSSSQTHSMLATLRKRYGDYVFRFSDYIMPKDYYTSLLPALAQEEDKYRLHTELKANHPPERVELLARAGFQEIQPGIESFATPVLKEMRKGVTSIQNVSLLKAGYLNAITVHYNILFGLPGDTASVYLEMLRRVPQLYHLIPPVTCTDTAITRFAPLQSEPARFGLSEKNVHHSDYDMLFTVNFLAQSGFSLDDYAYFFERSFQYTEELDTLYRQLCQQVDHWKGLHRERFVELSFEEVDGLISIIDSRFQAESRYRLSREASTVYDACNARPTGRQRLRSQLASEGQEMSEISFQLAVDELLENRLLWTEGEFLFGLAVPRPVAAERRTDGWCQSWVSLWR